LAASAAGWELISLILPHADTVAMSFYLAECRRRHPDEHILMFLDRAGWHQAKPLVVPENETLDWQPAYSRMQPPRNLVLARRVAARQPFGQSRYDSMAAESKTPWIQRTLPIWKSSHRPNPIPHRFLMDS